MQKQQMNNKINKEIESLFDMSSETKDFIRESADEEIKILLAKANNYNSLLDHDLTFELTTTVQITESYKTSLKITRKTDSKIVEEITENQKDKIIEMTEKILDLESNNDWKFKGNKDWKLVPW